MTFSFGVFLDRILTFDISTICGQGSRDYVDSKVNKPPADKVATNLLWDFTALVIIVKAADSVKRRLRPSASRR